MRPTNQRTNEDTKSIRSQARLVQTHLFWLGFMMLALMGCNQTLEPTNAAMSAQNDSVATPAHAPDRPGELRTATIDGKTFTYRVVDGLATIGGDMILGPADEVEGKIAAAQGQTLNTQAHGATGVFGAYLWWPQGKVRYAFASDLTPAVRSAAIRAIEHWEDATFLRFYQVTDVPRIVFRRGSGGCSSELGTDGISETTTYLFDNCDTVPIAIHEIGHAVALHHEHQREDRTGEIEVRKQNADPDFHFAFDTVGGVKLTFYDPYSIMHYRTDAFKVSTLPCTSSDRRGCTIVPASGSGIDFNRIGNASALTSLDKAGLIQYYRDQTPCNGRAVPSVCSWRAFNITPTNGGSVSFTLSGSGRRWMTVQGNEIAVAAGLNKRLADGTTQNLQFKTGGPDSVLSFDSGTLAPGTYEWYVHETNDNSGSVDMFTRSQ